MKSSDQIRSSRSLIHAAAALTSIDSNGAEGSSAEPRRKSSVPCDEPILKSLHILQRGGLTRHERSGYCQGGLTSTEVSRKLEM